MFPLAGKRSKDKVVSIESDEIGPAMAALRSDYSDSRCPGRVTELRRLSVQKLHSSRDLMVRCIIVSIHTGHTASMVFSDRPSVPIISLVSSYHALSKLLFVWGVFSSLVRVRIEGNTRFAVAEALMKRMKLADNDDFLLMIAGTGED